MRAALFCCLIATSCAGQRTGWPKPAWLEMQRDARAVALRYPPDSPLTWLNAVRSTQGSAGPNVVLERSRIILWHWANPKDLLDFLKQNWADALDESKGAKHVPQFKFVQVYRHGTALLVPTGEILITFRNDVSASEAASIIKGAGLTIAVRPVNTILRCTQRS